MKANLMASLRTQAHKTSPAVVGWVVAVALVGVALSWGASAYIAHRNAAIRAERLAAASDRAQTLTLDALTRPLYGMGGLRGALAAQGGDLDAESVRRYVRSRDMPREFPGVLGFGLIDRVPRDELDAWAARQAQEVPGFAVNTRGAASDLFVIRAIEPLAANRAALGFDVGTNAVRRAAIERARVEGRFSITGPIRLLQAPDAPGALIYLPVPQAVTGAGLPGNGIGTGRFVYAPVVFPDLMRLADPGRGLLSVQLSDLDAAAGERELYRTDIAQADGDVHTVDFSFGGRHYRAAYRATASLYTGVSPQASRDVLALGLVMTALLALLVWLLAASRSAALSSNERLSLDLARLSMVARLSSAAVTIADRERRVEWVNGVFEALSGFSLAECVGQRPRALIHYQFDTDVQARAMDEALKAGRAYTGEVAAILRDGRRCILQVEIQPILSPEGAVEGFVGLQVDVTESRRQAAELARLADFLDRTNSVAGVGGWELELATGEIHWSPETCRLHDLPEDVSPTLEQALSFYEHDSRARIEAAVAEAIANGTGWDLEVRLVSALGRPFWARAVGRAEREAGQTVRLAGAFQDITARKEAEQRLEHSANLLRTTLQSIGDAVLTTDVRGRVVWLNPVAERLTGWQQDEAMGRPASAVLRLELDGHTGPAPCPVDACLSEQRTVGLAPDTELVSRDGHRRFAVEDSCSPIVDSAGVVHGAVMVFSDVTDKRRMAREMNFRARHDALTGLINRGELEVCLGRALQSVRDGGRPGALLFLDLDHFKVVNDSCGHGAGDLLLKQICGILAEVVRRNDVLARFGGDEFAIVLERCPLDKAAAIANAICERVDQYRYQAEDGRRFRVGTSVGVVPLDARWRSVSALLQGVDEACYAAKAAGRGRAVVADAAPEVATAGKASAWGPRIEDALDHDRFELHAQRVMPLAGEAGKLRCEVLLRMVGQDGQLVPPGAFMPSAERYQLASKVDRWVLSHTLAMLKGRALDGIERIFVNLSGQSVGDLEFQRFAKRAIADSGVPPVRLGFEITETAVITNLEQARGFIEELSALGVQIALDDFGAGASSFGYLRQLRVHVLKIDGQFVKGMRDSPLDAAAVRCFADVADVQGLLAVAEHVETAEMADQLAVLGIGLAQGYHFHRPEPLDALLQAAGAPAPAGQRYAG